MATYVQGRVLIR